jgi:hypothetical protein
LEIADHLKRKATLRMLALSEDIARFAQKCASWSGRVSPGGTAELEDLDSIINELDRALVTVRTLDLEVFHASSPREYSTLRHELLEGRIVWALASVRDVSTHRAEVIDPDVARAVGPLDDGAFIIFPRWKPREELPDDVFIDARGNYRSDRAEYYDTHVADRLILDTLLGVFSFFDAADSSIAPRHDDGTRPYFPLAPLPIVTGYYRLDPGWPSHDTVMNDLLVRTTSNVPAGVSREVVGIIEAGTVICGWTQSQEGRTASFTEEVNQVVTDIRLGYRYYSAERGVLREEEGQLVGDDGIPLVPTLVDLSSSTDPPWSGWWSLASRDIDFYCNQRKGL